MNNNLSWWPWCDCLLQLQNLETAVTRGSVNTEVLVPSKYTAQIVVVTTKHRQLKIRVPTGSLFRLILPTRFHSQTQKTKIYWKISTTFWNLRFSWQWMLRLLSSWMWFIDSYQCFGGTCCSNYREHVFYCELPEHFQFSDKVHSITSTMIVVFINHLFQQQANETTSGYFNPWSFIVSEVFQFFLPFLDILMSFNELCQKNSVDLLWPEPHDIRWE